MRIRSSKVWRLSWLLTLPVALVYGCWFVRTADRFADFGIRHPTPGGFDLRRIGALEWDLILHRTRIACTRGIGLTGGAQLPTVQLFVPEPALADLGRALPHSGFTYVDGALLDHDGLQRVKVRYRGDNAYHWANDKKSLRVKTKKGRLFLGMRTFNLVAPRTPELLNNYLSDRLAGLLGVIAPRSELVGLALNGERRGVYLLTEQLSELTLRQHGLMPGDLYSGDLVGRDTWIGIGNELFEHPGQWEKRAVNSHYPPESMAPLERLIELLRGPRDARTQQELLALCDVDAFARFNALEILAASVHTDAVHNWRLYYDPWRQRFAPVAWDLMGWHGSLRAAAAAAPLLDVIASPLHRALYHDGGFLRARDRVLRAFFEAGKDREFLAELRAAAARVGADAELDPGIVVDAELVEPAAVRTALAQLDDFVVRHFERVRAAYAAGGPLRAAPLPDGIALSVDGRRPVDRLLLRYAAPPPGPVRASVRYWRGLEPVDVDVSGGVAVRGADVALDVPFLARSTPRIVTMVPIEVVHNRLEVSPAYYELRLDGVPSGVELLEVLADRGGRVEPAARVERIERTSLGELYDAVPARPVLAPTVWEGDVRLEGLSRIAGDVIVRPGTTVRLAPGAGVILTGRLLARGSAQAPIRFLPAAADRAPWATIALQGRGASGSRLEHCEFAGGSGAMGPLYEYSAMLSIHDAGDVVLARCRFRDSRIVDDMVHAVYSDLEITDCTFERAPADALDLDMCRASIRSCRFSDSGNDALDLMTSKVVAVDSRFLRSGDKGISVGESTLLLAVDDTMAGNVIGVQVKDGSRAHLYNLDLAGNQLALDAYLKNWRYEQGGRAWVRTARLSDNGGRQVTADQDSWIGLHGCAVDRPIEADPRRVVIEPAAAGGAAAAGDMPQELLELGEHARTAWQRVDPGRPGAAHDDDR